MHRPKYDDWSFPKGKQDPGEHVLATAVREVVEETGLQVHLGRPLPPQYYEISLGRSKVVNYWVARLDPSAEDVPFIPNAEVDEIRWFPLAAATQRLSYLDDVEIVDAFRSAPKRTHALVIVRHATAQRRSTWHKVDTERPLSRVGRTQARALVPLFAAYGITDLHTSPSARCIQTVSPYARSLQVPLIEHPEVSEEAIDDASVKELLDGLLRAPRSAALCSHRPVLPKLFDYLGVPEEPLAPAEFVVCHHRKGRILAVERHLSA